MSAELGFRCCAFCPSEKLDLYKCPKCLRPYCSLRCFRCSKHSKCSEKFYRGECERHIEFTNSTSETICSEVKRPITTFEEYMEQEQQQQSKTKNGANPQIAVRADEEVLFDSDDEPEYLAKIAASTMEQFESMDDKELERRLVGAGVPSGLSEDRDHEQLEQLYQQLTAEECTKFTELAEGIFQDEYQTLTNCFKKKK